MGQGEPTLGHPEHGDGLRRSHSRLQRRGIRHADVLAREDHETPCDEARVLPRLDHARQVVEGGVDIAAAHALDEGADDVVMLVAIAVVAHRGGEHRRLHILQGHRGARSARGGDQACDGVERREQPARIPPGNAQKMVARLR